MEIITDGRCTGKNYELNKRVAENHDVIIVANRPTNDDRWVEFKNHMEQLHEMQDEGCRGCERPETDCRKCMQDYYWDNIHCYLVEE